MILTRIDSFVNLQKIVKVGRALVVECDDIRVVTHTVDNFCLGVLRLTVVDQALITARLECDGSLGDRELPIRIGVKIVGVDVVVGVVDAGHGDVVVPRVDHAGRIDLSLFAVEICRRDGGLRRIAGDDFVQLELERLRYAFIDKIGLLDAERELALSDLEHIVAVETFALTVVDLVSDEPVGIVDEVIRGICRIGSSQAHIILLGVDRIPSYRRITVEDTPISGVLLLKNGMIAGDMIAVHRPDLQHRDIERLVVELLFLCRVGIVAALVGDLSAILEHFVSDLATGGEGYYPLLRNGTLQVDRICRIRLCAVHINYVVVCILAGLIVVLPQDAAGFGRSGIGDFETGKGFGFVVVERNGSCACVCTCPNLYAADGLISCERESRRVLRRDIDVAYCACGNRTGEYAFPLRPCYVFPNVPFSAGLLHCAGIFGQHAVDRRRAGEVLEAKRHITRVACIGVGSTRVKAYDKSGSAESSVFFRPLGAEVGSDSSAALCDNVISVETLADSYHSGSQRPRRTV